LSGRDRAATVSGMGSGWVIREAVEDDYGSIEPLVEAVAAEARWIGTELPVDHAARRKYREERTAEPNRFAAFVAEADGEIIGHLTIEKAGYGVADLGMLIDERWRGQGVAAIGWARNAGAHKVALQRWPHNDAAQALYEKFGFKEEGRLVRHYRRQNGELWDAVLMGLPLDEGSAP
jgi:RimJ/RimL family protein N-acetyltransferase